MSEDSFFNALFQIMWDMETDIFSEELKTLSLLADIAPKCKKQRKRLQAMYSCGAMELIEKAVADRPLYELNMKRAVRVLTEELQLSPEKAMFSVNQIAELWDGELEPLTDYDSAEPLDEEAEASLKTSLANHAYENKTDNNTGKNAADSKQPQKITSTTPISEENSDSPAKDAEIKNGEKKEEKDGEANMIFLQEMAEEGGEVQEEKSEEQQDDGGGDDSQPRESILKKIALFWCKSDFEDGRPFMIACPIGWILLIISGLLGIFMVYDIPIGDKFVAPSFALMFTMLTSKRLYRYESSCRYSLIVSGFYLAAMVRVLWIGKGNPPMTCIPLILSALIVFNSGRIGSLLDESKKGSLFAYTIIIVFAAAVTIGAYAIQQVEF